MQAPRTYDYIAVTWEAGGSLPNHYNLFTDSVEYVLGKLMEEGLNLEDTITEDQLPAARQKVLSYYGRLRKHKQSELTVNCGGDEDYVKALKTFIKALEGLVGDTPAADNVPA